MEGTSGWTAISFSSDGRRIVSGDVDNTVRLWNIETQDQSGDALIGHSSRVRHVSESSDGRFVVSCSINETIIWDPDTCVAVWKSKDREGSVKNTITDNMAETIIRSCGQNVPPFWPCSFPKYTGDVYCEYGSVHSKVLGEQILLGNLPSGCRRWEFNDVAKVFVPGFDRGGIGMCRLVR